MTREKRKIAAEEFKEWRDSYYNKNKLPATMFIEEVIKILEQEPCDDAISRQDAIRICEERGHDNSAYCIRQLPSVNPQEQKYCDRNICVSNEYNGIGCDECEVTKSQNPKTGHWDKKDLGHVEYSAVCSECGEWTYWSERSNFCPNCGAKMVEQKESEGAE